MRLFFAIVVFFGLMGQFSFANQAMQLPVDPNPLIIKTTKAEVRFDVEIADTPEKLQRGLMFRQDFPKNRAMLFVFGREDVIKMWMKNTPLPLDMLFVDGQGKIVSFYSETQPFSQMTISSGHRAAFAIEINAGEARRNGIKEGDEVIHPLICGACDG